MTVIEIKYMMILLVISFLAPKTQSKFKIFYFGIQIDFEHPMINKNMQMMFRFIYLCVLNAGHQNILV